jgi:hypothetical protein
MYRLTWRSVIGAPGIRLPPAIAGGRRITPTTSRPT